MKNNFNINLYKKSEQSSNTTKSPHEIVRFLMENLLKSMENIQNSNKNDRENENERRTNEQKTKTKTYFR